MCERKEKNGNALSKITAATAPIDEQDKRTVRKSQKNNDERHSRLLYTYNPCAYIYQRHKAVRMQSYIFTRHRHTHVYISLYLF